MTPEFPRPERIDTIGERPREVTIEAEAWERAALARRFGLLAVDRLTATLAIHREAGAIAVSGRVAGEVVQGCTVTGEPVPARIDEPVALRFVPASGGDEDELELEGGAVDTIEYDGGAVDLGEVAAETLALALDPFPRSAAADTVLREAGVLTEDEAREAASPFGKLAALRPRA